MEARDYQSVSTQSEESALDLERNIMPLLSEPLQAAAIASSSGGQQHSAESNAAAAAAAFLSWPCRIADTAEDRALYFGNLQKWVAPEIRGRMPTGLRASTLLELMTIRSYHSKLLRHFRFGTAVGFRIKKGVLTDIPAILVFVRRKVHRKWLSPKECLPIALEGPGGVWCDLDVVEFAYFGAPAATPKEQVYTELVDGFGGSEASIGSGSQVASQETYGTLGAIVRSRTGNGQVGFVTNRHVAVDLDYPSQKMFHPLPPSLGPGVYLGAVERATSFVIDNLWYGIFVGTNPETFVRADGAFIPFAEDFDMENVTTLVKGVGEIGDVHIIDLQSPIDSLVGRQVVKVGRSSGMTTGTIMAYSLEYNDENGICLYTDFLVVGENQETFDLEGDSGSLILLTSQNVGDLPRPVGIIWGGTANRGRLKLKAGQPPENWTSGVDLGRLLDVLELDLITSTQGLQDALRDRRNESLARTDSTVAESSPQEQVLNDEFRIESGPEVGAAIEHQFIPPCKSPVRDISRDEEVERNRTAAGVVNQNLAVLRNESDGEVSVSLRLGEPEPKRRKLSESMDIDDS